MSDSSINKAPSTSSPRSSQRLAKVQTAATIGGGVATAANTATRAKGFCDFVSIFRRTCATCCCSGGVLHAAGLIAIPTISLGGILGAGFSGLIPSSVSIAIVAGIVGLSVMACLLIGIVAYCRSSGESTDLPGSNMDDVDGDAESALGEEADDVSRKHPILRGLEGAAKSICLLSVGLLGGMMLYKYNEDSDSEDTEMREQIAAGGLVGIISLCALAFICGTCCQIARTAR